MCPYLKLPVGHVAQFSNFWYLVNHNVNQSMALMVRYNIFLRNRGLAFSVMYWLATSKYCCSVAGICCQLKIVLDHHQQKVYGKEFQIKAKEAV